MTAALVRPAQQPARPRSAPSPRRTMTAATVVDVGPVRSGLVRVEKTGRLVKAFLPDVLWLRPGDRVLLYPYPDGWVAVLRMVGG